MTNLLDGNVLIALTVDDHVHHDAVHVWWTGTTDLFATCPITQGTLIRFLLRNGSNGREAASGLTALTSRPVHQFWPDDASYDSVELARLTGHGQVTDAYLAGLARRRGGRIVTLDQAFQEREPDVATLIPVAPGT